MSQNLIIRNATLITAEGKFHQDLHIQDGKIVEMGRDNIEDATNNQEIDADGLLVLPGGIDPHVHLTLPESVPPGDRWVDDFVSGSQAAFAGGITTVGNISFPEFGETPLVTLRREERIVQTQAMVDVMLHPVIMQPSRVTNEEIQQMVAQGHTSIKIFMVSENFQSQYSEYLRVMESAGKAGMITMMHCEDAAMISDATHKLVSEGRNSLYDYAESRPVESEVLATSQAVEMCQMTRAPIYVVHLSCKAALQVCQQAAARSLPVYVETRPLYLHFTKERFHQADGPLFVGQPPLREIEDMGYLWGGLIKGSIHTLGTDHAPWTKEQKLDPSHDIINLRPGVSNLQVMLPMLYSAGVVKGKISPEQFVALTSTHAAKLFGLFPQKGTIAVGSDADLVLWDPKLTKRIKSEELFSRAGYSVYEGMEVTGWPVMTIRRGQVVYQNNRINAQPGSGRLPTRSKVQLL